MKIFILRILNAFKILRYIRKELRYSCEISITVYGDGEIRISHRNLSFGDELSDKIDDAFREL